MTTQLTDADLQPYLATPLTALYGFDMNEKLHTLWALISATEAAFIHRDMGNVAVVGMGGETPEFELPCPMFDPVCYSAPEPTWETRRMTLVDAIDWWKARLGFHADQSPYVTTLLMTGLSCPRLAVEHVERDLHPKIQAGLADFFVSLIRMGRRVIIDTHSIPLFDRLRVWLLWDPSLQDKVGVWVDGKPVDYNATLFPIALSDFGLQDEVRVGVLQRQLDRKKG